MANAKRLVGIILLVIFREDIGMGWSEGLKAFYRKLKMFIRKLYDYY